MKLHDFEVLTFDCYGTLIDWESGLLAALKPLLAAAAQTAPAAEVLAQFAIHEVAQQAQTPGMLYPQLLAQVHRRLARDWGVTVSDAAHTAFGHSVPQWPAFADSAAALQYLKQHYRLVILSNGDPDMLENARPHIRFAFDRYISIAAAGYFKPHVATYRKAAEILQTPIDRIMHVADHAFDCIGAQATGMKAAFINRRGRPYEETPYRPELVVGNFTELADAMT